MQTETVIDLFPDHQTRCKNFSVIDADELNALDFCNVVYAPALSIPAPSIARDSGCHYCGNPDPGNRCRYCGVTPPALRLHQPSGGVCRHCGQIPRIEKTRDEFARATIFAARCHGEVGVTSLRDADALDTAAYVTIASIPPVNPTRKRPGVIWHYPHLDEADCFHHAQQRVTYTASRQTSLDGENWHDMRPDDHAP